jgi:hypothetical protein
MSQTRRQQFEAEMLYEVEPPRINQTMRSAICRTLPWYANLDWAADEPNTALVLMTSPDNHFGVWVSVSGIEEARLLVSLARHGGGMYHHMHVTGFHA